MSFTSIISKIFGDKSSRDLKAIRPIVEKIQAEGPRLAALSNDELRAEIDKVRADIAAATADDNAAIEKLRAEVETLPFDKRQPVWDEIDKHEKNILDTLETQLNDHLPVVFATIRETAARFAKNETIEVTGHRP